MLTFILTAHASGRRLLRLLQDSELDSRPGIPLPPCSFLHTTFFLSQDIPMSTVYTQAFWKPITVTLYLGSLLSLSSMVTKRTPSWGKWRVMGLAKFSMLAILVNS